MAQKRPCEDQLENGISSKHRREMGEGHRDVTCQDMDFITEASGEGVLMVNSLKGHDKSANVRTPGFLDGYEEDIDAGVSRSLSLSPWAASSTSEEDRTLDLVTSLPFITEYFSFDRAAVSPLQDNDLYYYSLLDYPPLKSVPVGPDHQADVPELSETSSMRDENDEVAGSCVLPWSDLELPPDRISVGTGRTDCDCVDMGSVRCVRQHIMESREKLITSLGQEAFVELGFCQMGEVEAEKWSKNEQQVFNKVVHYNPVSVGKNFWNALFEVFPARTKMEIVSYYFNVFMLEKRAEQNRHDPTNIDSDDDEWQPSDDEGFDPGNKTDEENSALESPDDNDKQENYDNNYAKNNVHDSSYSSSNSGAPAQLPPEHTDCGKEWPDFILEPCDAKAWNGYSTCSKEETDFLPTCSMIQEVFGNGSLDADVKM